MRGYTGRDQKEEKVSPFPPMIDGTAKAKIVLTILAHHVALQPTHQRRIAALAHAILLHLVQLRCSDPTQICKTSPVSQRVCIGNERGRRLRAGAGCPGAHLLRSEAKVCAVGQGHLRIA